ncbi:MAG: 50S ribosomal protein L24 [Polyangiaceae bacterium]|nr:50S ribosomal protein L24 [Polyangiaceae bacterium]
MNRLKVGDDVIVISGEHKGKRGKVLRVVAETNRVVVEGVNQVKRHVKATPQSPGGILEVEAPLPASKVMPVDPETQKPTRVKVQVKDGKKVRVAKSGAEIVAQAATQE